jgi:hypothetical protein
LAAPSHAVTICRAAEILGEDEELLWDMVDNMAPEHGLPLGLRYQRPADRRLHPRRNGILAGDAPRVQTPPIIPAALSGWLRFGSTATTQLRYFDLPASVPKALTRSGWVSSAAETDLLRLQHGVRVLLPEIVEAGGLTASAKPFSRSSVVVTPALKLTVIAGLVLSP